MRRSTTSALPTTTPTSSVMKPVIHAHHIVVKNDAGGSSVAKHSHQILRTVGIDPYFSKDNLIWAPNWHNHKQSVSYRNEVDRRLSNLGITINNNPTETTVAQEAQNKARVAVLLKDIGVEFFNARIVME